MGIDFINKTKHSFQKKESERARQLAEQGLFGAGAKYRRVFRGHAETDLGTVAVGGQCTLSYSDCTATVTDNCGRLIASAPRLPEDVEQLLKEEACGTLLVTVEAVLELSGHIEFVITNES